jgi:DNA-binding MarR family transcriptional regulator
MIDRKTQIEGILQSIHAIKQRLLSGKYVLSARNQIPGSQWIVLQIVYQNEGIGMKELSRLLGISSSAATQLVDSLVKKEHLIREPNPMDRRALKIRLTPKTKKLIEDSQTQVMEKVNTLFSELTDHELQQYCELSQKVVARIQDIPDD